MNIFEVTISVTVVLPADTLQWLPSPHLALPSSWGSDILPGHGARSLVCEEKELPISPV